MVDVGRTHEAGLVARAAALYSVRSRQRKASLLRALIDAHDPQSVLLIGVEGATFPWSNIVERAVVERVPFTVATGLGPTIGMGTHEVLCDGRALPFRSGAFDIAISNAVIEHVGGEREQRLFAAEHHRVARRFVITTPNLLFPVESHTRVLFRHWRPGWRRRQVAHFTRLLTRRGLRRLLPSDGTTVLGRPWSPAFVAIHECSDACGAGFAAGARVASPLTDVAKA